MSFINKKSIGLDISDYSLEVVEMERKGGKMNVLSCNRIILEPGIVEKGRVVHPEELGKTLQRALETARPHPIKAKRIFFVLPENHVFVHLFSLNNHGVEPQRMAKEILEKIIFEEVQKNIPLDPHDLIFNYRRRNKEQILVVAASKKIIEEWDYFFRKCGLQNEFFDSATLAVYRGLLGKPGSEPICIVDMGSKITNVMIFDDMGARYVYALPTGGDALAKKIVRSLRISYAKAEQEMMETGLGNSRNKIYQILVKGLANLVEEIHASNEYFAKNTGVQVKRVILIGGTSNLKGIVEHLQNHFDATVELGHPEFLTAKELLLQENLYIGAIGAARLPLDKKWAARDPVLTLGGAKLPTQERLEAKEPQESAAGEGEAAGAEQEGRRFNVMLKFGEKGKVTEIKKSVVTEEVKKRRLIASDVIPPIVTPPPPRRRLRFQKIALILIICLGVALVVLAFLYRNYEKRQQTLEREDLARNEEYAQTQTLTLKLPVAVSVQDYNAERIRGRIYEDVIVKANDYNEAISLSRQNVEKVLQVLGTDERMWPEPLTTPPASPGDLLFPLAVKWLIYHGADIDPLLTKKIEELNQDKIPYALQNVEERKIERSADQNIYDLFINVTLALNEPLPDQEGEGADTETPLAEASANETQPATVSGETTPTTQKEDTLPSENAESVPQQEVEILKTEIGWLRVRTGPGLDYQELTRVHSGERYPFLEEAPGWLKIKVDEARQGWVSSEFATKR